MPTIRDVAKLANVSVATVSRVLNGTAKVSDAARKAVLDAQQSLGFYLNANAKALAQKDSETVGVLVSDLSDPYFGVMVKACEEVAHRKDKILMVAQGFHEEEREIRAINNLVSHQCSGLIIHALAISDEQLAGYMRNFRYMVLINRILPGFEERCVNINNFEGMKTAASYLISQGHHKIAYVSSSHRILDADERFKGYVSALEESGYSFDPKLLLKEPPSLEGGAAAAEKLLALRDRFTGVCCYNDAMAAGIMAKFTEAGIKIPEEKSIIGFDNLYMSSCLTPPLTTVTNPVFTMGQSAIQLSLSLYSGKNDFTLPVFATDLIKRKSVRHI